MQLKCEFSLVCAACCAFSSIASGAVTIVSIARHAGASSFVNAPPDVFRYGNSFSLGNSAMGHWEAGQPLDFSSAGENGVVRAASFVFQSSDVQADHLSVSGRADAATASSGVCWGDSTGEWFYFIRFSVDVPTRAVFQGSLLSEDGGTLLLTCWRLNQNAFLTAGGDHLLDTVLFPGTYDYHIQSHPQAHCVEECDSHQFIEFQASVQFSAVCVADFNNDSEVDFFDYLDFVDALSSSSTAADFNHDGSIDFFDYLDFVDAFNSGC